MELRSYWQVIWRRRNIILPLVLVTFVASAIANLVLPPTYKAETMVMVQAILPPPSPNPYFSQEYYRTVHSEYATDDLGMFVKTRAFAEKVAAQIESRYGQEVAPRDIMDSVTNAKKQHRTLKVTIATGSYALTKRISEAVDDVMAREGGRLLVRADGPELVSVSVIDPAKDPTSPSVLRRLLDVLLHSAVAGIVGVGIAFLLNALDDRVQSEEDAVAAAGWPVIGAIPADVPAEEPGGRGAIGWLGALRGPFRRSGGAAARPRRTLRNAPARRPSRARAGGHARGARGRRS